MPNNMRVIKASAGSGKTFMLTKIYIQHLLGIPQPGGKFKLRKTRDYHRHILAITFTNKATDEMKARIVEQLYLLSVGQGDYVNDLRTEFLDPIDDVIKAAGECLREVMFNYTAFSVSTIDSFFQVVLRTFARELNQEYDYDIQLDDKYAVNVALHNFLVGLASNRERSGKVLDWVKAYVRNSVEGENDWNFFGNATDLQKFAANINSDMFRTHRDEVATYLEASEGKGLSLIVQFQKRLVQVRNSYKQILAAAQDELKAVMAKHNVQVSCFNSRSAEFLIKIYNLGIGDDWKPTDANRKITSDADMNRYFLKAKNVPASHDELRLLILSWFFAYDQMKFVDNVESKLWMLGLLGEIDKKLEDYRKENHAILMADTNEMINTVLESNGNFIYERVGTKYNHFMIDEFQDTSRQQYANFEPLLSDSLSQGDDNLIIGDEKQSIYRFRNSDPDLLQSQLQRDFTQDYNCTSLSTNYRSFRDVVRWNNALFTAMRNQYLTDYPKLALTYNNVTQLVSPKKLEAQDETPGYVRIDFLYTSTKDTPSPNPVAISSDQIIEGKEVALYRLPEVINDLRDRGFMLRDIAILVNKKSEGAEVIERLLNYNKSLEPDDPFGPFDVMSAESLLLASSPSVRLIIAVLRYLEISHIDESSPELDERMRRIIRFRQRRQRQFKVLYDFQRRLNEMPRECNAGKVLKECFERNDVSNDAADDDTIANDYMSRLKAIMPHLDSQQMTLSNLVESIISIYMPIAHDEGQPEEATGSPLETTFLLAFQDEVTNFEQRHTGGNTIREFLRYWDESKDKLAVSSPADLDAVNVMTIHKSKGLQFPCVIIPFLNWELIKIKKDVQWITREQWCADNDNEAPLEGIDGDIVPPIIPINLSIMKNYDPLKSLYDKESEERLIDNINKTYVAMTRPVQELHMFATDMNENRISKLMHTLLDTDSLWRDDREGKERVDTEIKDTLGHLRIERAMKGKSEVITSCEIGRKTAKHSVKKGDSVIEQEPMPPYAVHQFNGLLAYRTPQMLTMRQSAGLRMHSLMQRITTADDLDRALLQAEQLGLFDDENGENAFWTRKQVCDILRKAFAQEPTATWFVTDNRRVFNERTLYDADKRFGQTTTQLRPDRFIERPDGSIIVVDYKFSPGTSRETFEKYQRQVGEYVKALRAIYPGRSITGYLWFLRSDRVVEIKS